PPSDLSLDRPAGHRAVPSPANDRLAHRLGVIGAEAPPHINLHRSVFALEGPAMTGRQARIDNAVMAHQVGGRLRDTAPIQVRNDSHAHTPPRTHPTAAPLIYHNAPNT